METDSLGNYVANRRKFLNLRQNDVASLLGYTTQAISSFEMGKSQISVLVLPELANLLNESLDDLLSCNEFPAELTAKNPKADPKRLKENLIALRKKENLSIDGMAKILGVNKRTITNYEKGITVISLSCLYALIKQAQVLPSAFFYTPL